MDPEAGLEFLVPLLGLSYPVYAALSWGVNNAFPENCRLLRFFHYLLEHRDFQDAVNDLPYTNRLHKHHKGFELVLRQLDVYDSIELDFTCQGQPDRYPITISWSWRTGHLSLGSNRWVTEIHRYLVPDYVRFHPYFLVQGVSTNDFCNWTYLALAGDISLLAGDSFSKSR